MTFGGPDAERYARIKELFFAAEELPAPRREAFLAAECGDDRELRAEVERLLRDAGSSTEDALGTITAPSPGAAEVPDRAPERVGDYVVADELGRGAMGVVYAAHHAETGRLVAVKIVHPHVCAQPQARRRFRREALSGQRVDHPNVVRTLELLSVGEGTTERDAIVLEHVEGRTLRALLREMTPVPEGLLREIAAQAAAGLAAIHEVGIVHRDMKPENLMLTHDRRLRIMDLGVAKLSHATTDLTRAGHFVGSLAYAAPEQLDTSPVGPAADLYSLGVLLYELATGTNPFRREHMGETIRAHMNVRPMPADERNPALSAFFAEVLSTLLRKAPDARFADALTLHRTLTEAERGDWWAARSRGRRAGHATLPSVAVTRGAGLQGRRPELDALRDAWQRARGGEGSIVLLEGEAGIGKTRLMSEFLQELAVERVHLLYGSYSPSGGRGALSAALLQRFGGDALETELAARLGASRGLAGRLASVILGVPHPGDAPPLAVDAVRSAFCELLRGLAREQPVVWVVDDVHFAPTERRATALAMARALHGLPVMIVLSTRPALSAPEREALMRLDGFRALEVTRLGVPDVERLLAEHFESEAIARQLASQVALRSDGVPLFVMETIRSLEDDGYVTRVRPGEWRLDRTVDELEVPAAIRDLVTLRLGELAADARGVIDAAAVCGFDFDAALVAAALEQPVLGVLQCLAELERTGGLVRSEGRAYRFDHHLVQEVAYRELPDALRVELHALLADVRMDRANGSPQGDDVVFVVEHHLRGARPECVRDLVEAAADHLESRALQRDAAQLIRRALDLPSLFDRDRRAHLLLRAARQMDIAGDRPAQRAAAEEARDIAREIGDTALDAQATCALAACAHVTFENDECRALYREALELAVRSDHLESEIAARVGLCSALCRIHDPSARAEAEALRDRAREKGHAGGEARALATLGTVIALSGDLAGGVEKLDEAIAALEGTDDLRGRASFVCRKGEILSLMRRREPARQCFEIALEGALALGFRQLESAARGGLGGVNMMAGRLENALEHYRVDLEIAIESEGRADQSRALGNIGWIEAQIGDVDAAEKHLDEAMRVGKEIGYRTVGAFTSLRRASLRLSTDDFDSGIAEACRVIELIGEEHDNAMVDEARLVLGMLHHRAGRPEEARAQFERVLGGERDDDSYGHRVVARLHLAAHFGGTADDARRAMDALGEGPGRRTRLQIDHLFWQATGDIDALRRAHESMLFMLDHAPARCRADMVERVALFRAVADDWAAHGD